MRALTPILLMAVLAAPALAEPGRVRDRGGSVALRILEIAALEARGEEKRVSGECLSACTMYLGLSTACFEPGTVLGFHGPTLPFGMEMTQARFDAITRAMADYYPPRIRRNFMRDWRHRQRFHRVPVERLIARGEARACD
jgi:hypothetical protein